jgi:hypothetical protein
VTVAGLLTVLGAGSASADSCPGRKVRSLSFSTGTVHVYKSGGRVCAEVVAKRRAGRKWMTVSVQPRGIRPAHVQGMRKVRLGPVSSHAGRRCVWVRGSVGSGSVSSGWILC